MIISFPDGMDFNLSTPSELMFPPGSSQGDIVCALFILFPDILLELNEDFVVELNTNDPAVVISEYADLTIITIVDIPDPDGIKH